MNSLTLENVLKENENFMIVLSGCPFCREAKELLISKNIDFKEINKNENPKFTEEAQKKFNHRTFPLIVVDRKFVGGCSELKKMFKK